MCEHHKWKQYDVPTRICEECGSIEFDKEFSKFWISAKQAVHLGFTERNTKYGLLELGFIPKIEELPA